jgi:hypothetical protein
MSVSLAAGTTVEISAKLTGGMVSAQIAPLKISVESFKYDIGGLRGTFVGAVDQSVTDDDTSYVYLNKSATLVINITGFPADETHVPLARVVAANGEIVAIHEERVLLASSSSSVGICRISLPVDGDVRGGDTTASSNNNWAAIRYDGDGSDTEARNRLVRRFPGNYVDGDLVVRVVFSFPSSIGNNKDMFWRCSYKFADLGDALGTMSSVTTLKECDSLAADTLYYLDLTIPEAQVDDSKAYMALYVAREWSDAQDNLTDNCYVHNVELRYNGHLLAGQAGQ